MKIMNKMGNKMGFNRKSLRKTEKQKMLKIKSEELVVNDTRKKDTRKMYETQHPMGPNGRKKAK